MTKITKLFTISGLIVLIVGLAAGAYFFLGSRVEYKQYSMLVIDEE